MPVIISHGGPTESGHSYDDKFGEYYTYPFRYRNRIMSGDATLIYRGRRDRTGGYSIARYVGIGVIGSISEIPPNKDEPKLLRCETYFVTEFPYPVPVKDDTGQYYEERANDHKKPSLWFSQGVRRISTKEFGRITTAAHSLLDNCNV